MRYVTYVSGSIDIRDLPKVNKMQIRSYLEEIYTMQEMGDVFSEDEITIEDELVTFEDSEKFILAIYKISRQLRTETKSIIMCTGEREGDIWAIIIKNNKVYTQRYELKPDGEMKEYEKVKG